MCDFNPECDVDDVYYDTCQECGARAPDTTSDRTNVHRPSDEEYRRQKEKLFR